MPRQEIEHVFVLMLENRSFDHMLGFSGLSGVDAETRAPTRVDGLSGRESNPWNGTTIGVERGAGYVLTSDPGHEFSDVVEQLCGKGAGYGATYPAITNSGFVESCVHTGGTDAPSEVMKCFDTARQLPVLFALAREFAVCDRWYSSMPGPTWPSPRGESFAEDWAYRHEKLVWDRSLETFGLKW